MSHIFGIALGGALGAVLRYLVAGMVHRSLASEFPWGTLAVNLSGSLCIGMLWALCERAAIPSGMRSFLLVGCLGAFTTFSTFALENMHLLRAGEMKAAVVNVVLSNVLGVVLAWVGYAGVSLAAGWRS